VVDLTLTVLYFLVVTWVLFIFKSDAPALLLLIACIFATYVGIKIVEWFFRMVGSKISSTCLMKAPFNDPLRKRKSMKKWCDQSWQLAFHSFFVLFALYILITNEEESWWSDTKSCWLPHPSVQPLRDALKYFYITQLASYLFLGFSHRFWEERRSDYVIMFCHHIATAILVAGSYSNGYHRVGLLILLIHDSSDVPVDLLKMMNYLKLEGTAGLFLTEGMFAIMMLSWLVVRLIIFPYKLIYSTLHESHLLAGRSPYARNGEFWLDLFPPGMPFWLVANICLSVLYVCHVIWFRMFARILWKIMTLGPHATGQQEHEGYSSSDDERTSRKKK